MKHGFGFLRTKVVTKIKDVLLLFLFPFYNTIYIFLLTTSNAVLYDRSIYQVTQVNFLP